VYLSKDSLSLRLKLKMAKKTKEQKILAEKRHYLYHLETPAKASGSAAQKPDFKLNLAAVKTSKAVESYDFVMTDLRKTALITGAILFTQLVLYFALNRV
jgi:hypothetical protein